MAALVAGEVVVPVAAFAVNYFSPTEPLYGVVESAVAGPPPTTVVVDWPNGTRVTYPVVGAGATSVLYRLDVATSVSLLGKFVNPVAIPNPGGRTGGIVTNQFVASDPSGNVVAEVVVVKSDVGIYIVSYNGVTVVGSA